MSHIMKKIWENQTRPYSEEMHLDNEPEPCLTKEKLMKLSVYAYKEKMGLSICLPVAKGLRSTWKIGFFSLQHQNED